MQTSIIAAITTSNYNLLCACYSFRPVVLNQRKDAQETFSNVWRQGASTAFWWGEARDIAEPLLVHREAPNNSHLAQRISMGEAEKFCSMLSVLRLQTVFLPLFLFLAHCLMKSVT